MKWKMLLDIKDEELEVGSYFAVDNTIYQIMFDEYKKEYFLILDNGRLIASDYNDKTIMMESLFSGATIYPVKPIQIKGDTMLFDVNFNESMKNETKKDNFVDIDITEFNIDEVLDIIEELLEDDDDGEYFG